MLGSSSELSSFAFVVSMRLHAERLE